MLDGKRVVITYGTYDLLHYGHVALFERAKALGDYLIVGVTSDAFDRERGKLNVQQSLSERLQAVADTGIPDLVIAEDYRGQKVDDIRKYGVDVFAIGSDWEGKFEYLRNYCDVVYLPRTKGVSSTELRAEQASNVRIGCLGADYQVARIVREARHVAGIDLVGAYAIPGQNVEEFMRSCNFSLRDMFDNMDVLLSRVDAVYVCAPISQRAALVRAALEAGVHVMCEAPLFKSMAECEELFELAESRGLVLMEALKTLYYPAFERLRAMLQSGLIGEIKDIRASRSHVPSWLDRGDRYEGSFYDQASYCLLPALSFIGADPLETRIICAYENDFCTWAKCELLYPTASATLNVGRGIKTEGDMVITGTQGYVYVPAPWWLMDYFEVRGEDPREAKRFYYECAGEGQRYELLEFLRRMRNMRQGNEDCLPIHTKEQVVMVTRLIERFAQGDVIRLDQGRFSFGGGETVVDR